MRSKFLNILMISFIITSSIFFIYLNIKYIQLYNEILISIVNYKQYPEELNDFLGSHLIYILSTIFTITLYLAFAIYIINSDMNKETKKGIQFIIFSLIGIVIILTLISLYARLLDIPISYWNEYRQIFSLSVYISLMIFILSETHLMQKLSRIFFMIGLGLSFLSTLFLRINIDNLINAYNLRIQGVIGDIYSTMKPIFILSIIAYFVLILFSIIKAIKFDTEY